MLFLTPQTSSFPTPGLRFIGLTGGIASGKSTATRTLTALGASVIDFDELTRDVVRPGSPTLDNIRKVFGSEYIDSKTGELLRAKLGEAVFGDDRKRRVLGMLMQSPIQNAFLLEAARRFFCMRTGRPRAIVLDAALLFESKMSDLCWQSVLIDTEPALQLQRLVARGE